ncbi:hypothetical protein Ciccas_011940 [Cichlidogyrus casuarinus]|uniref:Purine nucleoside phosphorylase n=1 Tax=Cichlidogyrus casuarinus TaxID=1844966 RepID=A0ABD2PQB7_9PLAT
MSRNDDERIKNICNFLKGKIPFQPVIAIVGGSGAAKLIDMFTDPIIIPYSDIPSFPVSTVPGHLGNLVCGELNGKKVILMQGRVHLYEGIGAKEITLPIRVLKLLGIEALFLTNAAGSINKKMKMGDFCIVKDHINMPSLSGTNPLMGPNNDEYGPRFPSMTGAYDKKLRAKAKEVAKQLGIQDRVHEGVYSCQAGPAFETPSELKFFAAVGCDLIGMSTAHEVIVARHMGVRCFCLSLVSNECVMDVDEEREPNHEEVLQTGKDRSAQLNAFIAAMVADYV